MEGLAWRNGSGLAGQPIAVTVPIAEDLRTGSHRRTGLLIAAGASLVNRRQSIDISEGLPSPFPLGVGRCITDLAPTIYGLLGEPPPHPLDGRPWTDLFGSQLTLLKPTCSSIVDASGLSDLDQVILEKRLADLGYL